MRPPRSSLALLLAVAGLTACRAATATRPSAEAERAPTALPVESYVLAPRPQLVVTSRGDGYLVLDAGLGQVGGSAAWIVTYVASPDRAQALAPDARARLAATADALLGAFRLHAQVSQVDLVSIVAVFGAPGGPGLADQIAYRRDARGWQAGTATRRELERVPPAPLAVALSPKEIGAPEVALEFLKDVDAGDYDAAWTLSSAVIKATMSRVSFERELAAQSRRPAPASPRFELYRSFPAGGSLVPGAEMEVWFALSGGRAPGLQSVRLRLDDDLEWRVAGVQQVLASAPGAATECEPAPPGRQACLH